MPDSSIYFGPAFVGKPVSLLDLGVFSPSGWIVRPRGVRAGDPFSVGALMRDSTVSRIQNVTPRHRLSVGATFHALLPRAATQAEIRARHDLKPSQRSVACFDDWLDDAQPDFTRRYRQLCHALEEQDSDVVEFMDDLIEVVLSHVGELAPGAAPSAQKAFQQRRDAIASVLLMTVNHLLTSGRLVDTSIVQIHQAFVEQIESQFGTSDPLFIEVSSVKWSDAGSVTNRDTVTFGGASDTVVFNSVPRALNSELPTLVEAGLRALAFSTRHGVPLAAK